MIKVLVTNDDGIDSEGIRQLVNAVAEKAEVYVCAPDGQRSASGHGITVGKPIYIKEIQYEGAKMALKCSGTPVDCVKLGLKYYNERGIDIDLVYSGINHGGNLGTDTLYSGTVSAAIEGAMCKLPAVALSVNSHSPKHFEYIKCIIVNTIEKVFKELKSGMVLNINVPNMPKEEVKGIKYTKLGIREYEEWLSSNENEEGQLVYQYEGYPKKYRSKNLSYDVLAMQEGYATITPLHFDLTAHDLLEKIWQDEKLLEDDN